MQLSAFLPYAESDGRAILGVGPSGPDPVTDLASVEGRLS